MTCIQLTDSAVREDNPGCLDSPHPQEIRLVPHSQGSHRLDLVPGGLAEPIRAHDDLYTAFLESLEIPLHQGLPAAQAPLK